VCVCVRARAHTRVCIHTHIHIYSVFPAPPVDCAPTECSKRGFRSNAERGGGFAHGAAGHGFVGHGELFARERRFPHCETHACRRAQTPPCLSHCPHRDVHGDASEPADRARVSVDRVAGARCRARMLRDVNNIYIYTACSQLRHTWAPPGEDHVGNNAQSVESGTLTAGKNVAWSLHCTQVILSAVLFASIPLGACPEEAGTVFQYLLHCLRTAPEAVGMDVR
jgi:hypothetical protein